MFAHDGVVDAATAEDTAVDFRVQGLHPAIHHFRETGVVRHFHSVHGVVAQQLEGTAGGENLHAQGLQFTSEIKDPGLVGNADQGAADRQASSLVGHLSVHQKARESAKKGDRFYAGAFLV